MNSKPEVVISGIGGIFPNSSNLDEFRDILLENQCTADLAKWCNDKDGNQGANPYFNNIPTNTHKLFDASFFGINRPQALYLDPMTRLTLEKTLEAIIDAGLNPDDIRDKDVPVLIGSTVNETATALFQPIKNGLGLTGQAMNMMANRISYWLNAKGASIATESSWTTGTLVLEQAFTLIQSGACDSVIVGVANCGISSDVQWNMDQLLHLSKDGKTRAFDENADGYCRSDGFIVFFIQRADQAKRNYATILHARDRFISKPGDLMGCDADNFANFLEECYAISGIDPKDIAYLETYGCGIKEIDENEIKAVEKVFCKNRDTPLPIGSVKTNIGHAETSSNFMSVVKIILAMETGIIPAHLNYNQPNKRIPALTNGKIEVVTKNKEWTGELAAINCLGLCSTYGHIILRRNQQAKVDITTDLPLLVTFSTRTEEGIQEISEQVENYMRTPDLSYNKLMHEVYSNNISGHLYHAYFLKASTDKKAHKHVLGIKPQIWFVYSGMGSQWHTMGKDLMKLPIFAAAVNKCHDILKPKGIDLLKIITDDDPDIFENILNSFVGIVAVQIGLTDVLNAIGIYPDGMIGHSVGELGCAYADKCLTAEQLILSAYYRGKASLEANLIPGMMAAVGVGYKELLALCPNDIDIACHNSSSSCTISGPVAQVTKFAERLQSKGIFVRLVNVSNIAYHSRYIKPAAPLLISYMKKIIPCPKERSSKWLSTSISQSEWDSDLARTVSAEYLTNNLLSFVQFEECLPFIPNNAVAIEIAPHGLLQAILKRALPSDVVNVALTRRDTNCLEYLFNSLGQLYLNGLEFNLSPLYPSVPQPVPRGTRSLCRMVKWEHGEEWPSIMSAGLFVQKEKTFDIDLSTPEFKYLKQYRIDNSVIAPPSFYIDLIIKTLLNIYENVTNATFEDVVFKKYVEIPLEGIIQITSMIHVGTGLFEIIYNDETIATGQVTRNDDEKLPSAELENNDEFSYINENNFYKELNIKGYQFPDEYKLLSSLSLRERGFKGITKQSEDWKAFVSALFQMHLFYSGRSTHMLLPKYIQRFKLSLDNFNNNINIESSVWYNSITNVLETNNGFQICGIKYQQFETLSNNIKIENMKFIQHKTKNIEDIEYGFDMCAKIVAENIHTKKLIITEMKEKYTPKYLPYITNYLNHQQIDVTTNELNELDFSALQDSSLTIITGKFLNFTSQIISNGSNFFLICFPTTGSIFVSNNYSMIAQFGFNNYNFYLVRRANMSPMRIINIKDDRLSYKNVNPWTMELKTMSKDKNSRIYIVSRTVPVEGIREFVTQMQNLINNGDNLRFLFVLDLDAPECKPGSEFYARIFEYDLVVQILQNGTWGSFIDICETSQNNETKTSSALLRTLKANDLSNICKINYIGLHPKDLTRIDDDSIPCSMGAMDFSGVNSSGDRIMGLAQTDLNLCKIMTDPELTWTVPKNWSLCDAATVPFAYTMAYYTLFTVGSISKGDTILVHAGASDIGQAALHVAYNYGCVVYTTVKNDKQKALIKKLVPEMPDEYIFNSDTDNFEVCILEQTKGRGFDVILNCLPGERLTASTRILTHFSRFIQLGTFDMTQYSTTGMKFLLKCCSFHGVTGQQLLSLPQEVKKELKEMITKDMISGVVKPIPRRIVTENRVDDTLRYLRSSTSVGAAVLQVNNIKYEKYHVAAKNVNNENKNQDSYLIYADLSDFWLSLIEWLIKRGAKRIIVANITNQNKDFTNRFILTLKQNYDTEIIILKNDANTIESSKLLVNEVIKFGSVTSFIFATDDKDNNNIFENIYTILRQNKLQGRMLCILGTNKEKSYFKANGIPVCNVLWDNSYNFQDVMKNFDLVLAKQDSLNIYLKDDLIVNDEKSKADIEIKEA